MVAYHLVYCLTTQISSEQQSLCTAALHTPKCLQQSLKLYYRLYGAIQMLLLLLLLRAVLALAGTARRPTYSAKLRLWTTLTCIGHTAVAGACGEVVRKRVAD